MIFAFIAGALIFALGILVGIAMCFASIDRAKAEKE